MVMLIALPVLGEVAAAIDTAGLVAELRVEQRLTVRGVTFGFEAEVYSAFELDAAQVADLVARLEKKTGRKVRARVSVDKSLIGGVKVAIGDKVIDGSARAQLGALETALKA